MFPRAPEGYYPLETDECREKVTQCILVLQTPALSYPVRLGNDSQLPACSTQGLPRCSSRRHGRFGQSPARSLFLDTVPTSPHFQSTQSNSGPTSNYQNEPSFAFGPLHIQVPLPLGYMTGLRHVFSSSLGYQLSRAMATFTKVIFPGPASVTHLEITEPR